MSERVFYPDTNDVSSASKVVALSIAVFRFNALTIQRFNEALAAKALATAARGESHWIDPCLLGVRLSVRTHQVPDHALIAGISFPGFPLEEFQS